MHETITLRAVNHQLGLPHNLGKKEPITPIVGRGYLNVTFMSTSVADPDDYTKGQLSAFYDTSKNCCMFVCMCPRGTPVLPLVLGKSAYAQEQEVLLAPGLLLVYQGVKTKKVGHADAVVHFYQVVPPK